MGRVFALGCRFFPRKAGAGRRREPRSFPITGDTSRAWSCVNDYSAYMKKLYMRLN